MFILTLEWFGLPDERKRHGIQLEYGFKGMSNDELRQAWMGEVVPFMDEVGHRRARALGRGAERWAIDCPFPAAFDEERKRWLLDDGPISWDDVMVRWKGRGPMNRDYVARLQRGPPMSVEARLWTALHEVEDPEIPVSVVAMGLIVSLSYGAERVVDIELTFTAMGCPAMDFIQDDIRERLLREPDVDDVRIEIVWDPVWTRARIREDARARGCASWGSWRDRILGRSSRARSTRSRCTTSAP